MARVTFQAVPKNDHKIEIRRVQPTAVAGVYRAEYDYRGTIVLTFGAESPYSIILPRNPDTIYAKATVLDSRSGRSSFPCTDAQHSSEKYFWYFWWPYQSGCKLEENVDFDVIQAQVQAMPNTASSYPELERLLENGVVDYHLLLGMDDPGQSTDPSESRDINADTYRQLRRYLVSIGFDSHRWSEQEIRALVPEPIWQMPHVETLSKQYPRGLVRVRMFFGANGSSGDRPFAFFFKDAIENASVLAYSGHSGLGEYLDLDLLGRYQGIEFKGNPNRYQIFFFNSCSSYPYYNSMFFDLKKTEQDPRGTHQLDIVTNGLATLFSSLMRSNLALLKPVLQYMETGRVSSYQDIVGRADSHNLLGVNGDDDNPSPVAQPIPITRPAIPIVKPLNI